MVREKSELYVTVPSFFKCPISMDVMKSPVSLCTGVTYDRSSIETWLNSGNNTCPATMQILSSTDVIPNLTLRRLIHLWSHSPESSSFLFSSLSSNISKQHLLNSVKNLTEKKSETYFSSLTTVAEFAKCSDENREFLANIDEFLPAIIGVFINVNEIALLELIVTVLELIINENGVKDKLNRFAPRTNQDCLSNFLLILQRGNLDAKIRSARVLEAIAFDSQSQIAIAEKEGLLYELHYLITSETDPIAIDTFLSTLIAISGSRLIKKELVKFGIVNTGVKILSGSDTLMAVIEKTLKVLEMVVTCTEGRAAICEDEKCVSVIMERLMKVSDKAREYGVTVVWSLCYLFRDRTAQMALMMNNGVTKVLLVMQSNCCGNVRGMCRDLVKVFRVNSKSCLASYDTRTTHIMPY
ncbi:hypothetical protein LguiB_017676 [Lonicera macranthoides]